MLYPLFVPALHAVHDDTHLFVRFGKGAAEGSFLCLQPKSKIVIIIHIHHTELLREIYWSDIHQNSRRELLLITDSFMIAHPQAMCQLAYFFCT